MLNNINRLWNHYDTFAYKVINYLNSSSYFTTSTQGSEDLHYLFNSVNAMYLSPDDVFLNSKFCKSATSFFDTLQTPLIYLQVQLTNIVRTYIVTDFSLEEYTLCLVYILLFIYLIFMTFIFLMRTFFPSQLFRLLNSISEQDIIVLDDFSTVYFIFVWLVIYNIGAVVYSFKVWTIFKQVFMFQILFLLTLTTIIPMAMVVQFGLKILFNIKGSLKKNSFFIGASEDIISLLAFCTRFYLQTCRWLLIFITIFMLHEFYFDLSWSFQKYCLYLTTNRTSEFTLSTIVFTLIDILRNVAEYVDVIFILLVQVIAFFAVLLWLLCFLFSTSIRGIYEYFFKKK